MGLVIKATALKGQCGGFVQKLENHKADNSATVSSHKFELPGKIVAHCPWIHD
jgi:hypothetical protein